MRSVFLDYATVSYSGDLDPARLLATLPGLDWRAHTPQEAVAE
jgi:hypothetical protein